MKKAFVVCNFFSGGGTERIALHLLRSLSEWDYAPWLVSFVREGEFVGHIPETVKIADLGTKKQRRFRLQFFTDVWKLSRLIRREKPDLVISIITHENVKTVVARSLAWIKTSVMLIDQTSITGWVKSDLPRWWLWKRLIKLLYSRADSIVTASRGIKAELVKLGVPPGRITPIYNPVPITYVRQQSSEPADFPQTGQEPVIIAVGGLRKQKGYPYLLRAFQQITRSLPSHLLIVGNGPDREELATLARSLSLDDRIHFAGFKKNPYALMARADIFMLPSLWEGFGIVIIEAMACGLPVVAANCPEGPGEIISDGVDGLLVPPADSSALAAGALRLLENKKLRDTLVKNADIRVHDFELSGIMLQYRDLISRRVK